MEGVSAICWTIQIAAEKAEPTTHDGTDVTMQYIIEPIECTPSSLEDAERKKTLDKRQIKSIMQPLPG
jgi:hypothetical protein